MNMAKRFKFGIGLAATTLLLACTSNGPGTGSGPPPTTTGNTTGGNPAVCTASISNGAKVATHKTALCLLCSVSNPDNVIDSDPKNFASINLDLSLLTGNAGLTVTAPSGVTFPAGQIPGFTLFVPNALLVAATVLPQIKITTFLGGQQQESSSFSQLLTLDLLGLLSNNNPFYLGIKTTKSFDAVDITVTPIVAGALSTLNVINACSDATGTGILSPLPLP